MISFLFLSDFITNPYICGFVDGFSVSLVFRIAFAVYAWKRKCARFRADFVKPEKTPPGRTKSTGSRIRSATAGASRKQSGGVLSPFSPRSAITRPKASKAASRLGKTPFPNLNKWQGAESLTHSRCSVKCRSDPSASPFSMRAGSVRTDAFSASGAILFSVATTTG